jgi:hypothetical protein
MYGFPGTLRRLTQVDLARRLPAALDAHRVPRDPALAVALESHGWGTLDDALGALLEQARETFSEVSGDKAALVSACFKGSRERRWLAGLPRAKGNLEPYWAVSPRRRKPQPK